MYMQKKKEIEYYDFELQIRILNLKASKHDFVANSLMFK